MSNQLLTPPEIDTDNLKDMAQSPLWSNAGADDGSFWQSLTGNFREALFPQNGPELHLQSKPIPVADPLYQRSIWVDIWDGFREVFLPSKLPPLQLESRAIAVQDPMAHVGNRKSSILSIVAHLVVLAIVLVLVFWKPKKPLVAKVVPPPKVFNITPFMPIDAGPKATGGGGGGGDHELVMAAKGNLPKIAKTQFVPPSEIIRNSKPKLAVEPTVVMPKNINLPPANMPNLGDPLTKVTGPLSNGTGAAGGIGSGRSGGVGSGSGAGVGPGQGGGYGGGIYQIGNGVTPPKLIYEVDAEFSDEARQSKFQGECAVQVIVDAHGIPRDPHVVRPLGMGLDQKAIDAVKQYRFKPAMFKGKPVPVYLTILVDFHIY